MRRLCVFCLVVLLAVVVGCSRATPSAPIADGPAVARLDVIDPVRSLGMLALGEHQESFQLVNSGTADLHITTVSTSCGCVKTTLDRSVIAPGGTATLSVVVRSERPKKQSASLTIISDAENPRVQASLSWDTQAVARLSADVVDFGRLIPGETSRRPIDVFMKQELAGTTASQTKWLSPDKEHLTVQAKDESSSDQDAATFEIVVQAGNSPGSFERILRAEFAQADIPADIVRVRWRVANIVQAEPEALFLGVTDGDTALKKRFTLSTEEATPLTVESLVWATLDPALEVYKADEFSESRMVFVVQHSGGGTTGLKNTQLIITCSQPAVQLELPVSWLIRPKTDNLATTPAETIPKTP